MSVPLVLVAAVARNGVIGADNRLLWRLSSDLKRFKARTMGKPLVMGRKTFQSIGRPLPGRDMIVLTRDSSFSPAGALVAHDLEAALTLAALRAAAMKADAVVIAGGGELYAQTLPRASRLAITEVALEPQGDVRFPPIDPAEWREVRREPGERGPRDEADFAFVDYERRASPVSSAHKAHGARKAIEAAKASLHQLPALEESAARADGDGDPLLLQSALQLSQRDV